MRWVGCGLKRLGAGGVSGGGGGNAVFAAAAAAAAIVIEIANILRSSGDIQPSGGKCLRL
jgi:hypothetical protein